MTSQTQPTRSPQRRRGHAAVWAWGLPDAARRDGAGGQARGRTRAIASVDTASVYRNEDGVGAALLGRTDVFVTTKLGNSDYHGFDEALRAFDDEHREAAAPRHARSVPDPLAAPARQPLCRELEGARPSAEGRTGPLDRRLELQPRSSSNGSLARRASRPPSTRSSFIQSFSRRRSARFTIRRASKRNPGARWDGAAC